MGAWQGPDPLRSSGYGMDGADSPMRIDIVSSFTGGEPSETPR